MADAFEWRNGWLSDRREPGFSIILKQINANLVERWRKMEMVRSGCDTALKLIDNWMEGHPETWRPLTLAGTLLVEWGGPECKAVLWKSPLPPSLLKGDPDHNQSGPIVVYRTSLYLHDSEVTFLP
jgi:hypothetical protein